ncbi:hypothetical protein E3Q01_00319 [Wallemia mellicola]|uniref:MFS general substrate transporter n=1 Tax=Wallemia mellicola TaxID=1708541 RepID=A0A4T0TWP7_9BASI|nr:hypothetical protein E3Q01_00319 [Wallemia mellicola]
MASGQDFNVASAITFGIMILTVGLKWTFVLGTFGYIPYGWGLYMNSIKENYVWLLLFGAAFCGISAGLFWSSEGSVFVIYPAPEERGKYLSAWAIITDRFLGPALGGAINLGINAKRIQGGSVDSNTYIVFAVLMCVGCGIAFLLPSPEKVERKDGSKVKVAPPVPVWDAIKAYWRSLTEKRILLLLPLFFFSFFYYAYMSAYLTRTFNVRSRAFSSLVSPMGGVLSSYLASLVLDSKRLKVRTKSTFLFFVLLFLQIGLWVWLLVIHYVYNNEYSHLDWSHNKFAIFYIPNILFFFNSYTGQSLFYWTVSNFSTELNELTRYVSIIRSIESMGQSLSWILTSNAAGVDASGSGLIIVNLVGIVVSLGIASPIFLRLNHHKAKEYDDYFISEMSETSSEKSKEIEI